MCIGIVVLRGLGEDMDGFRDRIRVKRRMHTLWIDGVISAAEKGGNGGSRTLGELVDALMR